MQHVVTWALIETTCDVDCNEWKTHFTFLLYSFLSVPFYSSSFFYFANLLCPFPSSPLLSSPLLSSSLMGLRFHWHVFANNRPANTDHSILRCPNISDCFHIRTESLETPQHLLFMVAINYSPWYELQSRKAKLETVAHFDRERKVDRDRRERERKDRQWGSKDEISKGATDRDTERGNAAKNNARVSYGCFTIQADKGLKWYSACILKLHPTVLCIQ